MKERVETFLSDMDNALAQQAQGRKLKIYHIGRSAIVCQYGSIATTDDVDILVPHGDSALLDSALRLFGFDTQKHKEHGLYLQKVDEGLPPVAAGYEKRATQVARPWKVLELHYLDPHDLAVTKLRRFAAKDREDIRFLCDQELLDPEKLKTILEQAFLWTHEKDGDEFRDAAFRSLGVVQSYLRGEIDEF